MARGEINRLNFVATTILGAGADGGGAPFPVVDQYDKWVQLDPGAGFAGTFQIQGRIVPSGTWVNIGSAFTSAGGLLQITQSLLEIRVLTTVNLTSGTPQIFLASRMIRGEG
jgi:hypothetical protein